MGRDALLDEIQELNFSYLLLVQKLLREDPATAMFRLKLNSEAAELLASLSARQIMQLSRSRQLLCRIVLDDAEQLARLTQERREPELANIHAALLAAAVPPAGVSAA